jgi:hypothetical protein
MYGTDWHELLASTTIRISESYGYHRRWRKLFSEHADLRSAEAAFFGENAASYLGIRKQDETRRRLDAFFAKNGVAPEWAGLV